MKELEVSFRVAISLEPWCDVHRFAYADWLSEQGQDKMAKIVRAPGSFVLMGKDFGFISNKAEVLLFEGPASRPRCGAASQKRAKRVCGRIAAHAVSGTPHWLCQDCLVSLLGSAR